MDFGVEDAVAVGATRGGESRMEALGGPGDAVHRDGRGELSAEGPLNGGGIDGITRERDDLAGGMHALVGPPGDEGVDAPRPGRERGLELALDRAHVRLPGVPMEARPVVGQVDPIGGH